PRSRIRNDGPRRKNFAGCARATPRVSSLAAWRTRMAAPADPKSAAIAAVKTADAAGRSNLEPRLCYDDLRQWVEEARKLGEVKDVSGLSWQQDIGMVAGMVHDDGAPCFVFGEVPGTIKGSRVLVNFFGGKRKNMTLGFPTDLSKIELSEGFRTNFMGPMTRIAPRYVDDIHTSSTSPERSSSSTSFRT